MEFNLQIPGAVPPRSLSPDELAYMAVGCEKSLQLNDIVGASFAGCQWIYELERWQFYYYCPRRTLHVVFEFLDSLVLPDSLSPYAVCMGMGTECQLLYYCIPTVASRS